MVAYFQNTLEMAGMHIQVSGTGGDTRRSDQDNEDGLVDGPTDNGDLRIHSTTLWYFVHCECFSVSRQGFVVLVLWALYGVLHYFFVDDKRLPP